MFNSRYPITSLNGYEKSSTNRVSANPISDGGKFIKQKIPCESSLLQHTGLFRQMLKSYFQPKGWPLKGIFAIG